MSSPRYRIRKVETKEVFLKKNICHNNSPNSLYPACLTSLGNSDNLSSLIYIPYFLLMPRSSRQKFRVQVAKCRRCFLFRSFCICVYFLMFRSKLLFEMSSGWHFGEIQALRTFAFRLFEHGLVQ